jgi:hypothetical protein
VSAFPALVRFLDPLKIPKIPLRNTLARPVRKRHVDPGSQSQPRQAHQCLPRGKENEGQQKYKGEKDCGHRLISDLFSAVFIPTA